MHSTRLNAHSASPGANRAVIHAIDKDIPALDAGECLVFGRFSFSAILS